MSPYIFYIECSGNQFFFLPTLIYKTYCPTMFGAEKETSYCVSWLNSNNQVLMICKFFFSLKGDQTLRSTVRVSNYYHGI